MVRCENCDTPNSLDSRFCKACGKELSDEARRAGQEQLEKLIAEGYRLLNEDRADEALLLAESILANDADCAQALSLKGASLERQGDLVAALEAFERVVELCPDSAIDRVKVTHLRKELAQRAVPRDEPDRRRALLAAVGAAVVVIAAGGIVAAMLARGESAGGADRLVASREAGAQAEAFGSVAQPQGSDAAQQPQQGAQSNQGATQPNGQAPAQTAEPTQRPAPPLDPGGVLPRPLPNGEIGQVPPVSIPELELRPENPPREPERPIDPPPSIEPASKSDPQKSEPERDPGVYEIRVYTGAPRNLGGGEPASGGDPNQLTALLRTARQQFQLGQYAAAARTYEQALRAGGDPATIHQRLGQCYASLGQKAEASLAYTRAIQAWEQRLSQNPRDEAARHALEACRQALKVLQGS
ncbi:MAG: tetratricopeptide repeat protein [Fimbriimonadales bacterium]|nr:tetratricopeptide repeat protein [Fimbriimonadales bacterium]